MHNEDGGEDALCLVPAILEYVVHVLNTPTTNIICAQNPAVWLLLMNIIL